MPCNVVDDSFHAKKLCGRLSSSELRFYTENGGFCVFEPPFEAWGQRYDVHLRLIGNAHCCLPISVNLTFLLGEVLRANID